MGCSGMRGALSVTRAEHVRLAVEELGVASIKIGQLVCGQGSKVPESVQANVATQLHPELVVTFGPTQPAGCRRR